MRVIRLIKASPMLEDFCWKVTLILKLLSCRGRGDGRGVEGVGDAKEG